MRPPEPQPSTFQETMANENLKKTPGEACFVLLNSPFEHCVSSILSPTVRMVHSQQKVWENKPFCRSDQCEEICISHDMYFL